MPFASATTVASGSTANVAVPFSYLQESDVNITLNGVLVPQNTYTWTSPSVIQLGSIPAATTVVVVSRTTDAATIETVFQDPSVLEGSDLNNAVLQVLYVAQEAFDASAITATELATITDYVNTAMAAAGESATAAAASASAAATSASASAGSATAAAASQAAAAVIAALVAAEVSGQLIFVGSWDASAGTFPGGGTTAKGSYYLVSVAGTVNGEPFAIGDTIFALVANASTTVYAANWIHITGYVTSAEVVAALGFTPPPNSRTITASGLVTGGGDLTANRTVTVTASTNLQATTGTDTTTAMTPASTAAAIAGSSAKAKPADVQTFTSSGTWTKPTGFGAKAMALLQCWGAGGGGNGAGLSGGLAGGGGGSYAETGWVPLSSLAGTLTVTIGAAGLGGISNSNTGGAGGDTTIGSLLTGHGGGGATNSGGGVPGAGLTLAGVETRPDWQGGTGAQATNPAVAAFGGGGGGGSAGNKPGASSIFGGAGGTTPSSGTGGTGVTPSGGGASASAAGGIGGPGGGGQARLTVIDGA